VRQVLAQGARHAAAGVILGVPAAFLLARFAASLLFGVTAADPLTFTLLPIGIVAATTAACYLPARRASQVDPAVALRTEEP
jgi:ABC-type antimicrobial peptide transport system permease subunit